MTHRFLSEGSKVVINYNNTNPQELENEFEYWLENNSVLLVKADISIFKEVEELKNKALLKFEKVDVLINNAGICSDNPITLMNESQWQSVIDINLTGTFNCSKSFSKDMILKEKGKIINIASLKGQIGSVGQTNYCTSKAAIIGFTKTLALELGRFNISVNAVCPGFIVTDMNRHNTSKKKIALGQSVLKTNDTLDDLLNFITFMSSDLFTGVSGQIFSLDSRIK